MKNLIFSISLLFPIILFGQNKRKQIDELNLKIDSLIEFHQLAKEKNSNILKEMEYKLNEQEYKIKIIEDSIFSEKKELKKYRYLLVEYEDEINSLKDSIRILQAGEEINILDKSMIKLTDDEIVSLMNIDYSSLGNEFYDVFNQSLRPIIKLAHIQPYKIGNTIFAFTIVNIVNPQDCNGCSGTNIIGCLEMKDNRWVMKNSLNTNSSPSNSWGEAAEYVKCYIAGKSVIGIDLYGGQTGSGVRTDIRNIYLINKSGQIIKAYDNLSHTNDSGNGGQINDNWDIRFIKSEKEYFDIEEIKSSNGKKVKTRILNFDTNFNRYQ